MTTTGFDLFDRAIGEANRWVQEMMEDLGTVNRHRAYSALRSVLHAIRDHLPFKEAMDLAAALPPVVRGFYLDGWKPGEARPKEATRVDFLSRVAERLVEVPDLDPDDAARAVFGLLSRKIDEGKLPDVRARWGEPLRGFWTTAEPGALPDEEQRSRVEKVRKDIQDSIESARREGVPEHELPALSSRPPRRRRRAGP